MGNELNVTPESLVPRLGEYLVDAGVITADQLQRALEYQKTQEAVGRQRLLGQALSDLGFVERDRLDQAIAVQLVKLHEALQDSNRELEVHVGQRTEELEQRIVEIRTAAEITQMAVSITNLDELFNRTANLIADRFGYAHATIFLIDATGQYAVLREASGSMGKTLKDTGYKLAVGSQSMVGWVAAHNQPRVSANVGEDPFYLEEKLLPDIRAEATIPIAIQDTNGSSQLLGILDVQHTQLNAFDQNSVVTLQTIANHIAAKIHNIRLYEKTQRSLREVNALYQASRNIARADKIIDIIDIATNALKMAPYVSGVLLADHKRMIVYSAQDRENPDHTVPTSWEWPTVTPGELFTYFKNSEYQLVDLDTPGSIPESVLIIPRHYGCKAAAYMPIIADGNLEALFILGSRQVNGLTDAFIQAYASLSEQTTTAVEKVYALLKVEKRLAALQSLNSVSQAVSVETDLQALYQAVHNEVTQIMGDVNFIIALYDHQTDMIHIPYMYEGDSIRKVEPFPLGEGLTSILIRTRQPLMIVDDTENKARELGAIVLGAPAKSWMGVPLLIGGEAIGAMIVQDLEEEFAFDDEDLRLLSTLALQIAAGFRNARMLESTHRQSERDRLLHEISRKIRVSPDMQSILRTTAEELGKYTGARRAHIELGDRNSPSQTENVPPFPPLEDNT